jgi:hypothetical protein
MKPVYSRIAIITALCCYSYPCIAADIGCSVDDLVTEISPDAGAIALREHHFLSENYSAASFFLENKASKDILNLTLILEYRTTAGDHTLSIVYQGRLDGEKDVPDPPLPAESVTTLDRRITPGQRARISGQSPYILPECPSSARLTMLDIQYADHSNYRWTSGGWRAMPLLSDYPDYLVIPDSKLWKADRYYFLARVDRTGHFEVTAPFPPTTDVPSASLQENLRRLSFSPTLRDDKPEDATILLIVRFHRTAEATHPLKTVRPVLATNRTAVFVDLAPRNSLEVDWYFYYGGGRGYKTTRASLREK